MRLFGMAKIYTLSHRVPSSSVLSISSELILQLDSHLRIIYVNEPFVEFLNTSREELIGKNIQYSVLVPVLDDIFGSFLDRVRNGIKGVEWKGELFIESRGTIFTCRIAPTVLDNGKKGASVVFEDITGQKEDKRRAQASEEKYRLIVETANEGVWILDRNLDTLFSNQRFADMLGYTREGMTRRNVLDLVMKEDQALFEAQIIARMKGIKSRYECRLRHRDGRVIWCLISGSPLFGEAGSFQGSFGMVTDITERKQALELLKESEEKFRRLVENTHDIIYTLDKEGVFTFVSPGWTVLLGHPLSQVVGKSFKIFVHPDDIPICMEGLEYVMTTGKGKTDIEYRVQRADGSWAWHSTNGVPHCNGAGVIIGFEGCAHDITDRKQMEDQLILLKTSVDQAYDEVFWLDFEGTILYGNDSACKTTGYSREELQGMKIFKLDPDITPEIWERSVQRLRERKRSFFTTRHRRKDGTILDVEIMASYVRKGINEYSFAFVRDITDRNGSKI